MKHLLLYWKKLPDKTGYLLILPFYLIFFYFCFFPVLQVIYNSFTDYALFGTANFVGLKNYTTLLHDTYFKKAIANTFLYAIGSLLPTMVLGFLTALLVNSSIIKAKLARTLLFTPHVLSMVAVSMVWLLIYDPAYGYLNIILRFFGFSDFKWLQNPDTALFSIILMSIWKGLGYNMIINLSGLQNISDSYYEVAMLEGASFIQKVKYVTIPMMSSTTFFLFVTGIIGCFNVFEQVNIMTSGGPADSTTTIVHQIYTNGFAFYKMGYASAESVILLLIVITVTLINMIVGKKYSDVEMG